MNYLVLDVATAGIDGAGEFISTDDIEAPSNYKDPEKIAAYCEGKRQERIRAAGLDVDLARITGIGYQRRDENPFVQLLPSEADERAFLPVIADVADSHVLVSFNGLRFDWPLLMRRALYLDVDFPTINLDRYRTPHLDVWDQLSHHGILKAHSLTWYARRFGWTDLVKPLSGAEEATAAAEGKWDELKASIEHDVIACARLAAKMRLIL